jgi:hypothetical protein
MTNNFVNDIVLGTRQSGISWSPVSVIVDVFIAEIIKRWLNNLGGMNKNAIIKGVGTLTAGNVKVKLSVMIK